MSFSKRRPAPGLALLQGLLLLLACTGSSCDSSPHARATIRQSTVALPMLVRQGQGRKLLQLSNPIPGLTLTTVRGVALPGVLRTNGQIAFDDRRVAKIISRVTGRIEQVHVSQWDSVRRGQPIVTLYSPDYMTGEAEYLQAKDSAPALAQGGAGNAQFARSLVEAARRKLELLGIEADQIAAIKSAAPVFTMRAPISGIVVQNQALRGSAVSPGDVLYSVGTLDDVWIIASIYEDDLAQVHVGQQLEAVATAYPDRVFKGFISRISPDIDPTTHTLQIRCEVRNPGALLKPQMLARVRIVTRPGIALVVPQEALVFDTNHYYAFVEAGRGLFQRREVSIASWQEAGYARVTSGLKPGDRVVVKESIQINSLWNQASGEG
jgi:membrane fusion protein, copper/silver efflux system